MSLRFSCSLFPESWGVKLLKNVVMYQSMCKFWWGEGSGEENGFHIWPRIEDLEVVKG